MNEPPSSPAQANLGTRSPNKQVFSWALYDWANSAFTITVVTAFFPIMWKSFWRANVSKEDSTFLLGSLNSFAGLCLMLTAPLIGAIADRTGHGKRYVGMFAFTGAALTFALSLWGPDHWHLAGLSYVGALICFLAANVCYDSLLLDVAYGHSINRISALGYALGYLGGGIACAMAVLVVLNFEKFGFPDTLSATRVCFAAVGLWWTLFTLPLLFNVKTARVDPPVRVGAAIRAGFAELKHTAAEIARHKPVLWFLFAYWLYIDGVDTMISMSADFAMNIDLETDDIIKALLIVQFIAFPAALAFGKLGDKIGPKSSIYIALGIYTLVCVYGFYMDSANEFYVLAATIGLVMGGVQSLSRSLFSQLIPYGKKSEFFGFYNMLGKFATVLGPFAMGLTGKMAGNARAGILALIVFFVAGAIVLSRVKVPPRTATTQ